MRDMASTLSAQEVTDLTDLISHPGWRLVEVFFDREWGPEAFAAKVANALGKPKTSLEQKELALAQLEQATVSREAVIGIMKWPREQVAKAKQAAASREQVASMNRGGR